jgi:hypothetical protein
VAVNAPHVGMSWFRFPMASMGFCIGLILPADSSSSEYQGHFRGQRRPVRRTDLTILMCWLSRNSESFNLLELYPYLIFYITYISDRNYVQLQHKNGYRQYSLYDGPTPKLAYFVTFLVRGGQVGDLLHPLALAKLTVPQLVKKCPALYENRYFITAFTTARHLSLSCFRFIQYTSYPI